MVVKLIDFEVPKCPRCDLPHQYKLKILAPEEQKVMLFGGAGNNTEVLFTCLQKNSNFTYQVPTPPHSEVAGVATDTDITQYAKAAPVVNPLANEFSDWIKSSRTVAIDYSKNMLTTSTAAIAVYFSILKFLGFERRNDLDVSQLMIAPPVLFLVAAIVFILGLRPVMGEIEQSDFTKFRSNALLRLNRMTRIGTMCFLLGIGLCIIIFAIAL